MAQDRQIKYINRNFSDFRDQLIEFAKNYFPDTYNDFSPTSPGMMFIEMASYVGDVLSFYQDTQLQETFLQYSKDAGNLYNLAYMMGYRPKVTTAAGVILDVSHTVPSISSAGSYSPDWTQAMVIAENAVLTSSTSGRVNFITDKKVDFAFSSSLDPTTVVVETYSGDNPATYRLSKKVNAFSGEIKTITRTFDSLEKFNTITIDDEDIIGILSITDDSLNTWYEVPFLGQETVFVETRNTNPDNQEVYNTLQLQQAPRRFVTRFTSTGQLNIQFGAGTVGQDDSTFIPTLENVGLGTSQGISRLDYAYDPSNFLYTRSYGLAPSGTLTIKYLVGGGVRSNVPQNTITIQTNVTIDSDPGNRLGTLTFNNLVPATGGSDGDTVEDLRQNSLRAFNEQGRTVTLQDYEVRALSLSPKLGNIAKVYATQDQISSISNSGLSTGDNPLAIALYTLAYDLNGNLTTSPNTLKENLRNYLSQYITLTDSVDIKDAFIINIGVEYEIVISSNYLGREVLLECTNTLVDYFDISKWKINQPIVLTNIMNELNRIKGVSSVQKISIVNKSGGNYSIYGYGIEGATKNNIVYPSLDPSIFEVKFPRADIKGRIVTL